MFDKKAVCIRLKAIRKDAIKSIKSLKKDACFSIKMEGCENLSTILARMHHCEGIVSTVNIALSFICNTSVED